MGEFGSPAVADDHELLVDRAVRLFRFLGHAQQLRIRPVNSADDYARGDGMVLWLDGLRDRPAVTVAGQGRTPAPEETVLTIDRIPPSRPPEPDDTLRPWLAGRFDDPDHPPALRESLAPSGEDDLYEQDVVFGGSATYDDRPYGERPPYGERRPDGGDARPNDPGATGGDCGPEVRRAFDDWLVEWRAWAEQERQRRPVRDAYTKLFAAYQSVSGNPELLEIVVGVGLLAWHPDGHEPVQRHLLTAPATIRFDDHTGRLSIERVPSLRAFEVELDMLDPRFTTAPDLDAVRREAESLEAHPLDRDALGGLVRRLVNILDPHGMYQDRYRRPPEPTRDAVASFAPAVILRRRSQRGLVDVFRKIEAQLEQSRRVHDGLLPLVDPDFVPTATSDRSEGAMVTVDDELFLPLQINDAQRRILERVDTSAQTVVQGPPGTGKTHTAAALLSHLLAQGKRVLVTAQTDRALKEVRNKLPERIKPLAVALVGSSREDMSDLKLAVERLADASDTYDRQDVEREISSCLTRIDELRRQRAALYRSLVDARREEVQEREHLGARGTLAAIAQDHRAAADRLQWLEEYARVEPDSRPPLDDLEIQEWHGYLCDSALVADEPESRRRLPDLAAMPEPEEFAAWVRAERAAAEADRTHGPHKQHPAYGAIRWLAPLERQSLQERLHSLAEQAESFTLRREEWIRDALQDVLSGRASTWHARAAEVQKLLDHAAQPVRDLGSLTEVTVTGGDLGPLVNLATALSHHLRAGGKLKTGPDGTPRIGALSPRPVKDAQPLFERVRVNGLPPTSDESLAAFLAWVEATRALDALDRAWPASVRIPAEDTLAERLQWHLTEVQQLQRLLRLAEQLEAETGHLKRLGVPVPDWSDLASVRAYADLVDAATAEERLQTATEPLRRLEQAVADVAGWDDAAPVAGQLLAAVRARDPNAYSTAHQRLRRLAEVRDTTARRDALADRLSAAAPRLREAVEADPLQDHWRARLARFTDAWRWAATSAWLRDRPAVDVNDVQAQIREVEERLRHEVEHLAATRAWGHAVSPERLTRQARADLQQYAYLVRRYGKGTGKYAAKRQVEIRQAMERCRPAVPVWIMPLYRVVDQLDIKPDMFDVVIVDEASQAGAEAAFLLYLAPRIVVIGDDKQVSPAAVGVDQQQLRDLAAQYLADDPYRAGWQDPKRSLFDLAKERFGSRIVLTEHRRCVPEIIGFSNEIAYEPDGIRLVPVRQIGADRLEPIKPVFVRDGYVRGSTHRVNPPEVDAVVDQIEKCLADPRYDGLTFGVISLLGKAQAEEIQKRLLERIPPEEWHARDLRCGDSADFQGSERDVMFLTMVAAPGDGVRLAPLTQELYVQRYNVAASRAKDQMWLFHSVQRTDLVNPEDMRFRLLDYCYRVSARQRVEVEGTRTGAAPEDRLVAPFESLFEQRVFNRLDERGYTVVPQFPVGPYRIDLVVVGARTRLAVECDGDAWHGPDAYQRDLARQRDLERCDWRFFRIRESDFYADQSGVLERLWATLREMEIHPAGWGGAAVPAQQRPPAGNGAPDATKPPAPSGQPAEQPDARSATVGGSGDDSSAPGLAQATLTRGVAVAPASATGDFGSVEVREPVITTNAHPLLEPYVSFEGALPAVDEASTAQLVDGLVAITAVEGPVLGTRLHAVYVRASGGQRVGHQIARTLNSALRTAVRQGRLVSDDPLRKRAAEYFTYRLPDQPDARLRELGPRPLREVPPRELARLLEALAHELGRPGTEELFRAALHRLGLQRLTDNVHAQLFAALTLTPDWVGRTTSAG